MAVSRTQKQRPEWQEMLKRSLIRSGALIGAIALFVLGLFLTAALLTYHRSDPSFSTVAGGSPANAMGMPGAYIADLMIYLLGPPTALFVPLIFIIGRRMWGDQDMSGWQGQLAKCLIGAFLVALGLSLLQPEPLVDLPAGWGGMPAMLLAHGITSLSETAPEGVPV